MVNDRCATCAFRPGTEASRDPTTLLMARLCLLGGDIFQCHEIERAGEPCAGFLAAKIALPEPPGWQQQTSAAMLDLLAEAVAHPVDFDSEEKIVARIRGSLECLNATGIGA